MPANEVDFTDFNLIGNTLYFEKKNIVQNEIDETRIFNFQTPKGFSKLILKDFQFQIN